MVTSDMPSYHGNACGNRRMQGLCERNIHRRSLKAVYVIQVLHLVSASIQSSLMSITFETLTRQQLRDDPRLGLAGTCCSLFGRR